MVGDRAKRSREYPVQEERAGALDDWRARAEQERAETLEALGKRPLAQLAYQTYDGTVDIDAMPEAEELADLILANLYNMRNGDLAEVADIFRDISTKAAELLKQLHLARTVNPPRHRHSPFQFVMRTLSEALGILTELDCIVAVTRKEQTRREAAAQLNVHENTVARWVKDPASLNARKDKLRRLALSLTSYRA